MRSQSLAQGQSFVCWVHSGFTRAVLQDSSGILVQDFRAVLEQLVQIEDAGNVTINTCISAYDFDCLMQALALLPHENVEDEVWALLLMDTLHVQESIPEQVHCILLPETMQASPLSISLTEFSLMLQMLGDQNIYWQSKHQPLSALNSVHISSILNRSIRLRAMPLSRKNLEA